MDKNTEKIEQFERLLKIKSLQKPTSIYKDQMKLKTNDGKSNCGFLAKQLVSSVAASLKAMQSSETVKLNKNVRQNLDKHKRHMLLPLRLLNIEDNQPKPSTSKFDTQCITDTQLMDVINRAEALGGVQTQHQIVDEFETSFSNKHDKVDDSTVYFNTSIEVESQVLHSEVKKPKDHVAIEQPIESQINNKEFECQANTAAERNIEKEHVEIQLDKKSKLDRNDNKTFNRNQSMELVKNNNILDRADDNDISELVMHSKAKFEEHLEEKNGTDDHNLKSEENEGIYCTTQPPSPILSIKSKGSTSSSEHLIFDLNLFEDFEKEMGPLLKNPNDFEYDFVQSQILGTGLKHETNKQIVELQKDEDEIVYFSPSPILGTVTTTNCNEEDNISPDIMNIDSKVNNNKEENIPKTSTPDLPDDFLKDEIIFSSDEENDYVHKELQELPFTCVLETSFYANQSDVLDKSMYIDFDRQTNTESYIQANEYFETIQLSVSDLVEIKERDSLKTEKTCKGKDKDVQFNDNPKDEAKDDSGDTFIDKILLSKENLKEVAPELPFVGFKTASNKAIKLSNSAHDKIKQVFQDIDLSNDFLKTEETVKVTKESIKVDNNEPKEKLNENFNETKMELDFNEIEWLENINQKEKTPVVEFKGFTTASNKNIEISEKALTRTEEIFQDIDLIEKSQPQRQNENHVPNKPAIKETSSSNIEVVPQPKFVGFKTVSNKNVDISKKALDHCKKVFQDIDLDNNDLTQVLYKSHSKIQDPNNGIDKTRHFDSFKVPDMPIVKGFQTASKKPINISENAIANTEDIFKDINNVKEPEPKFIGFKTASKKAVTISKDAIEKTKDLFKDIDTFNNHEVTKFKGFETASRKPVTISKEALEKTKDIFKEIDSSIDLVPEFREFQTAHTKPQDPIAKTGNKFEDFNNLTKTGSKFMGFQTASKKPVTISKDAIEKTKDLFKYIDSSIELVPEFEGFQTANKKPVVISKESITKAKGIFQDEPELCKFKGFQTANNKAVHISETALLKSKDIFKGIDFNNPEEAEFNDKFVTKEKVATTEVTEIRIEDPTKTQKTSLKKVNTPEPEDIMMSPKFGFQTANMKKVKISKSALARTKRIFQDFEDNFDIEVEETTKKTDTFGFKTANNNNIKITQESLFKSKKLLADEDKSERSKYTKLESEERIDELINTQVLNNFAEELNTEDFLKTPKKKANTKRPGSPILSCPKAKKRKVFVTPYKIGEVKNIQEIVIAEIDSGTKYNFDGNYKKKKIIDMTCVASLEKESNSEVEKNIELTKYNFDNIIEYDFVGNRNTISNTTTAMEDIKKLFLDSVSKKIVPDGWFENHYKLILWKLIQYEIKYPKMMSNVCNTKEVLEQLKYRYARELYKVERPALRKIMEKDDLPSRTLVLSVASILVDGVSVASVEDLNSNVELTVTDGWYSVRTVIDKKLSKLVFDKKIVVGIKLVTNGAELLNCDQGISPWEDTSKVRLKIFGNSTRKAKWDAKLGFHGNAAILVPLSSVRLDGGKTSKLRLLVTRVYPLLYVEKFEDGSTVTRSEKLEQTHQMKYETERQILMEKIYDEVEKEFDKDTEESSDSIEVGEKRKLSMDSGSQIAKVLKRSKDPIEFRAQLTNSQTEKLVEYTLKRKERILQEMQARAGNVTRNVAALCKTRVADLKNNVCCGMMSIWRPNDAILDILKEGEFVDVLNVFPTAIRNQEIQLTAGRQSVFSRTKVKQTDKSKLHSKTLLRICHNIKDLVRSPTSRTDYNEIDTVGLIIDIEPSYTDFEKSTNKLNFQNVFLADFEKNLICLNFWGGVKKFGFQNVLDTGQVVYATNLQKRVGNTRKSIPHYRATEFSWFTKTPKDVSARANLEDIQRKLLSINKRNFVQECLANKNNANTSKYANENISPYRPNISDYNLSKHRIYIESPLTKADLSLNGLDFESTFKQKDTQAMSPEEIARKKRFSDKMAKLKMYGEPPPLSPVLIIKKSKNASSDFKSPLCGRKSDSDQQCAGFKTDKDQYKSETSDKKVDGSRKIDSNNIVKSDGSLEMETKLTESDLDRTYVKRSHVNPVRIDFSKLNDSATDHFAEEFDASPPLSLD